MPDIEYTVKRYRQSRSIKIAVYPDGRCLVTAPKRISELEILRFVRAKSLWIKKQQEYYRAHPEYNPPQHNRQHYLKHKETAREFILDRLNMLNQNYRFNYHRVAIRNQKYLWGSCSRQGNLNFNYRIMFLPPKIADYIIVHELCHLKELNHSAKFWQLVAKTMPNYLAVRKDLRHYQKLLL